LPVSGVQVALALWDGAAGWRLRRKSSDIWFIACQRATSRESCGSENACGSMGDWSLASGCDSQTSYCGLLILPDGSPENHVDKGCNYQDEAQ